MVKYKISFKEYEVDDELNCDNNEFVFDFDDRKNYGPEIAGWIRSFLKRHKKNSNITMADICSSLDVSTSCVSKWANNKLVPERAVVMLYKILKLSNTFGHKNKQVKEVDLKYENI